MTTRDVLRQTLRMRKEYDRGTAGHEYLSRDCRKLRWIMTGFPVSQWPHD